MKKIYLLIFSFLFGSGVIAQVPNFDVRIENENQVSATEYQFDIMLYASGTTASWELAGFTVGIGFDSNWCNGVTFNTTSAAILMPNTSDMNTSPNQVPISALITGTPKRLQIANTSSPGSGNGTIITPLGKRLIRVRLLATSGTFNVNLPPRFYWLYSGYPSSLSAYIGGVNTILANNSFNSNYLYNHVHASTYWFNNTWQSILWSSGSTYFNNYTIIDSSSNVIIYGNGIYLGDIYSYNFKQSANYSNTFSKLNIKGSALIDGNLTLSEFNLIGKNQIINNNGVINTSIFTCQNGSQKSINNTDSIYIKDKLLVRDSSALVVTGKSLYLICLSSVQIEAGSSAIGYSYLNAFYLNINQQPQSVTSNIIGSAFDFKVSSSSSSNRSFQWYHNGISIFGATDSIYSISTSTLADTGNYYVTISSSCGMVTSNIVRFDIHYFQFTLQPTSSISKCSGLSTGLSVQYIIGSGAIQYMRWLKNGVPIPGAFSTNLNFNSIQKTDTGIYQFEIMYLGTLYQSSKSFINVTQTPVITSQSQSILNEKVGSQFNLFAYAVGDSLTYTWYHNNVIIANSNSPILIFNNPVAADAGTYIAKVSNTCATVNSANITVYVVQNILYFTSTPASNYNNNCVGQQLNISASANSNYNLSAQWYKAGVPITGVTSGGTILTSLLNLNPTRVSDSGNFEVRFWNFIDTIAYPFHISSISSPNIISQSPSHFAVLGSNDTLYVNASGDSLKYMWYKNNISLNLPTYNSNKLVIPNVVKADSGDYMVRVYNNCANIYSNLINVKTDSTFQFITQPKNSSFCLNTSITLKAILNVNNLNYQWYKNGIAINGATNATYTKSNAQLLDSGIYHVVVWSNFKIDSSIKVTVYIQDTSLNVSSLPNNVYIYPGYSLNLNINANTKYGNINYQWYKNGNMINASSNPSVFSINSTNYTDSGVYMCKVNTSCRTINSNFCTVNVTTNPIPVQPIGGDYCLGNSLSLICQSSGINPVYQWYKNGVLIQNSNVSNYKVPQMTYADTGIYYVKILDPLFTVNSSSVYIGIKNRVFAIQPMSQINSIGNKVLLNAVVNPSKYPVSVSWYKNGLNMANGNHVSGVNSFELFFDSLMYNHSGQYVVKIFDGCQTIISDTSFIGVYKSNAYNLSFCQGNSAQLYDSLVSPYPITYQWKHSSIDIVGANNNSYYIPTLNTIDSGNYYIEISTKSLVFKGNEYRINVSTAPVITTQPKSQIINKGKSVLFTVEKSAGTIWQSYQWYKNNIAIGNTGNVIGTNSNQLLIVNADSVDAATYKVRLINDCGVEFSQASYLSVITKQSLPVSACLNSGAAFSINTVNGGATLQYQWMHNGQAILGANTTQFNKNPISSLSDSGFYYCQVSNGIDTFNSDSALLKIKGIYNISNQDRVVYALKNHSALMRVWVNYYGNVSYQWFKNQLPLVNTNKYIGWATSELQVLNTLTSDTGYYILKITSACGQVLYSDSIYLGLIIQTPTSTSRCVGDSVSFTTSIIQSIPLSIKWYKNGQLLTGVNGLTYSIPQVQLNHDAKYSLELSYGISSFVSDTFELHVNSIPKIANQPISQTVFLSQGVLFKGDISSNLAVNYQWYKNSQILNNGVNINGVNSSELIIPSAQSSDIGDYYFTVSNQCGTSISNVVNLSLIQVNSYFQSICNGSNLFIQANINSVNSNIQYQWLLNGNIIPGAISKNYAKNNFQYSDTGQYILQVNNNGQILNVGPFQVYSENVLFKDNIKSVLAYPGQQGYFTSTNYTGVNSIPTFKWYKNGILINNNSKYSGANRSDLIINQLQLGDTGTYHLEITNTCGMLASSDAYIGLITNQIQAVQVCVGSSFSLNTQVVSGGNITYKWYKNNQYQSGFNSNIFSKSNVDINDTGKYYLEYIFHDAHLFSDTVSVFVNGTAANITRQVQSQFAYNSQNVLFSVGLNSNYNYTYQWYKNGVVLTNSARISGANSSELLITNVNSNDVANYYLSISNACGTFNSNVSNLILIQNLSNSQMVCNGSSVTLNIKDTSTNISKQYSWFLNGKLIQGATNSNYTISTFSTYYVGKYTVQVKTLDGMIWKSDSIELNINNIGSFNQQPISQVSNLTNSVIFNAQINPIGTAVNYQWKYNGVNLVESSKYIGVNSSQLIVKSLNANDSGQYELELNNNCGSVKSNIAYLGVIIKNQGDKQICVGTNNTINGLQVNVPTKSGMQFNWYKGNVLKTSSSQSQNLVFNTTSFQDSGYYHAEIVISNFTYKLDSFKLITRIGVNPIITHPKSIIESVGKNILLNVDYSSTYNYNIQWRQNGTALNNNSHFSGVNTKELFISSSTLNDTVPFDVQISDACNTYTSQSAQVFFVDHNLKSTKICYDGNTQFTLQMLPKNKTYTYKWVLNSTILSGDTMSSIVIDRNKAGDISAIISSTVNSNTITVQTASVKVTNYLSSDVPRIVNGSLTRIITNGIPVFKPEIYDGVGKYSIQFNVNGTDVGPIYSGVQGVNIINDGNATIPSGSYSIKVTDECLNTVYSPAYDLVRIGDIIVNKNKSSVNNLNFCVGDTMFIKPNYYVGSYSIGVSGSGISTYTVNNGFIVVPITTAMISSNMYLRYFISNLNTYQQFVYYNINYVGQQNTSIKNPLVFPSQSALLEVPVLSNGNNTYNWYYNGQSVYTETNSIVGAHKIQYIIPSVKNNQGGIYYLVGNNTCNSNTFISNLVVISQEPKSISKCIGNKASFSVSVIKGSATVTYQWLKNGVSIVGATDSIYTINSVQAGDYGLYSVNVTCGSTTLTTGQAELAQPQYAFYTLPQNVIAQEGQTVQFSSYVSGANLKMYWMKDSFPIYDVSKFSGIQSTELLVKSVNEYSYGKYRLSLDSICSGVYSTDAYLTVVSRLPSQMKVCVGKTFQTPLIIYTKANNLSYQWMKNGVNMPGQTALNLNIPNATASDTGIYYLSITQNFLTETFGPIKLTLYSGNLAVSASSSLFLYNGQNALFNPVVTNNNQRVSYNWLYNGIKIKSDSNRIFGSKTAELFISGVLASDFGTFSLEVSDECYTVYSPNMYLNVVTFDPITEYVCLGNNLSNIKVNIASVSGETYQWFRNGTPIPGKTSSVCNINNATYADSGDYTVLISNSSGSMLAGAAHIQVHGPPQITLQPQNKSVVQQNAVSFTVKASGSGVQYFWYRYAVGSGLLTNFNTNNRGTDSLVISPVPLSYNGYKFVAQARSDCGFAVNSDTVTLTVTVNKNASGISESLLRGNNMFIYPNPAEEKISFYTGTFNQSLSIEIYDYNGKLCKQLKDVKANPDNDLMISLSNWSNGVYFWRVFDENHRLIYQTKFIHN